MEGNKVYCYELDKSFDSVRDTALYIIDNGYVIKKYSNKFTQLDSCRTNITNCCKNKSDYFGILEDGTKLHWKYVEDESEES